MIASLRKFFIPILVLFGLGFVLMLINQVVQLYTMASQIHPILGQMTALVLASILVLLVLIPLYHYFRLPPPLRRPSNPDQVDNFKNALVKRLTGNPILMDAKIDKVTLDNLDECLEILNRKSNEVVQETARIVFLTTSISQNGKLDAFTVFVTQVRMVWKVAHIYYQRPALRELFYLYGAVGGSAFIAGEIEDLDLSRQVEPIVSAMVRNSSGKSVPLIGPAASLILDSIVEGSTNAFLTLRVGYVTQVYCGYPDYLSKKKLRSQAITEATRQLKVITVSTSGRIISSLLKATRNAGMDTLKTSWEGVKSAGTKVRKEVVRTSSKLNPFGNREKSKQPSD